MNWRDAYDPGVPWQVDVPHVPLYHFLDCAAAQHPRKIAIRCFDGEMTYREVLEQANAFAAALHALGVRAGARVLLLLPNIPQAVVAFYGALKAGAIVVLSNPLASAEEIAHQIADCGAETVVTVGASMPAVLEARDRQAPRPTDGLRTPELWVEKPTVRIIHARVRDAMPKMQSRMVSVFGDGGKPPRDALHFLDLLNSHRNSRPPHLEIDPNDVAVLSYTGGTTGLPRAVMLTHRSLVANTIQVRAFYSEAREGEEKLLAALPFSHAYGLTAGLSLTVFLSGCLVLLPSFRPGEALRAIAKHRPTLFPGVPAMYVSLINHPRVKTYKLSSVRACISGAAPLPIEVKEAFERLSKGRLVEGYGLTEASPVTHSNPLGSGGRPGSIGVPLPSTEARIVDWESGRDLPVGEVGELLVRGPQLMKGYWGRPEETDRALRDGWLHTGDLATMDGSGYFTMICRRQDVISLGENQIYPRDIEEVLYEHSKVRDVAVVGGAAQLEAHVVLRRGMSAQADEIIEFCRRRLSPHKIPALVTFRESLPRTPVGKLLRRLL